MVATTFGQQEGRLPRAGNVNTRIYTLQPQLTLTEISSAAMWTKWFQHPSELWFYIPELVG